MFAVDAAQKGVVAKILDGSLFSMEEVQQDKSYELRYSRHTEFNDEVASEFLSRKTDEFDVCGKIKERNTEIFLRPFIA
ncbi:hypothetical protein OAG86_01435 [Akkermansiaceae bacterium]|nr:hypothetical protein [Akkermansiaceae bacterium]